jgi:hypothetical protein
MAYMLKLRNAVAGAVLAGAALASVAAAPAQAATASTPATASAASQASYTKHWFDGYSSYGGDESRGERSYYKGYYYFAHGRYYFDINVWDRDRDREKTVVDFWYHDDRGWHQGRHFTTGGHGEYRFSYSDDDGFDGFKLRIGEGHSGDFDWSHYYDRSW